MARTEWETCEVTAGEEAPPRRERERERLIYILGGGRKRDAWIRPLFSLSRSELSSPSL